MLKGMDKLPSTLHVSMNMEELGVGISLLQPQEVRLLVGNHALQGGEPHALSLE
jgi:ribosome biogenesis protein Nip4